MEKYTTVFCANPDCGQELNGTWDDFRVKSNDKVVDLFKCPKCGTEHNPDDMPISAIEVTGSYKADTKFIVIRGQEIVGEFNIKNIFESHGKHYIHVPSAMLIGAKFYSVPNNASISDILIAINSKKVE